MRYSCVHTHTSFCDGEGSVEELCQAAFERGLEAIGFSAHAPLPKAPGLHYEIHLLEENFDAYVEAVLSARNRWEGKLTVYLGLEVDYIPGILGPADFQNKGYDFDFLIGSVHYLVPEKGSPPFAIDGDIQEWQQGVQEGFGGDYEAAAYAYWQTLREMIQKGNFDILGHMDLIKKNHHPWLETQAPNRYLQWAKEVIPYLENTSIIVEINTGGLIRRRVPELYPAPFLLKELAQHHIPVTINADAHRPEHLGLYYETAHHAALKAGYTTMLVATSAPPTTSHSTKRKIHWEEVALT
ncbi:MAG TPA: histidinol-phosphatase [Termitinemataceae bacterium]|uniref:histidinol-phosphatase n=1 Tax=Treponema sp. J25 TaxID=2094121 RepID=UPI00104FE1E2|nr:histidinol-phosphatase [Treponema sp. J25]TCW60464.1 histidinol-phosphatase [Treponema sp. J25]HOJ98461.1 histidinol-phosphatase [Termitinemataceae bacterium]HOM22827.1 histidinol-phosphatase [Termitinemataceae bacterium]HPP99768.1 histidinol-phosphatase [Termitinemataceae bacterium]